MKTRYILLLFAALLCWVSPSLLAQSSGQFRFYQVEGVGMPDSEVRISPTADRSLYFDGSTLVPYVLSPDARDLLSGNFELMRSRMDVGEYSPVFPRFILHPPAGTDWSDVILKGSRSWEWSPYEVFLHTGDRERLAYTDQTTHTQIIVEVQITDSDAAAHDGRRLYEQDVDQYPIGSYLDSAQRLHSITISIEDESLSQIREFGTLRWVVQWLSKTGQPERDDQSEAIWRAVEPEWVWQIASASALYNLNDFQ